MFNSEKNERLMIPNFRTHREPKLFSFFPECKNLIQLYCNDQIKAGSMSTDSVTCEIRLVIEYDAYIRRVVAHPWSEIITVSTVWRWLQLLGYKYSENKRNYYTDGHEREDVIKDRNNNF